MQSPALDSYAAEAAAESQGSFSIQPPALDSPLSRKASSVRFTIDHAFTPDTGTDELWRYGMFCILVHLQFVLTALKLFAFNVKSRLPT